VNSQLKRIILSVVALSFIASVILFAPGNADANVTLQYFTAVAVEGGIELEWKTATEFSTEYYYVKRATSPTGFLPIDTNVLYEADAIDLLESGTTTVLVESRGTGGGGATYTLLDTDDDLVDGNTYWYRLVEIEQGGNKIPQLDDDTSATVGDTATPTPDGTGVGLPTSTPVNNSTATATAQTTPTATATAGAATPTATATARPTTQATATPIPPAGTATPLPTVVVVQADTSQNGTSNGGVPVAEAASQESYPGEPTRIAETPEAYIGDQIPGSIDNQAPDAANESGAAMIDGGDGAEAPSVIGSADSAESQLPPPASSTSNESSTGNRAILWVGFIAALLIFAAGVFGSILIFTRRRSDDI
jgi:hypothetical protein